MSSPTRIQTEPGSAAQSDLARLVASTKQHVEVRLAELFKSEIRRLRRTDPVLGILVGALADLSLRGGKRLRALLAVIGESAAGGRHPHAALEAGVALELLQSYFLVQDDWMDQDPLRRGGPTVHKMLEPHVASVRLAGVGAVLAGDYAQALAAGRLAELQIPAARLGRVMQCFAQMQADVVLGQTLDLLARQPSPAAVCALKTTSYTVRGPLLLGALLGGARPQVLATLEAFAAPAGLGFQLRDDLLGIFASAERTGKPSGNDLREGKPTLLSKLAFQRVRGQDREWLAVAFGNPKASAEQIRGATAAMENCGARRSIERKIQRLAQQATASLDDGCLPKGTQRLLRESIPLLLGRQF